MPILHEFRKPAFRLGRRLRERRALRSLQSHERLWAAMQDYRAKSRSTGARYAVYDVLYRTIRERKPREVLECGTGVSTVVIAHALLENAWEHGVHGRVTSMEDVPRWFEMAAGALPEKLAEVVDLRFSPKVEAGYTIFRGVRYADLPERRYEFVFTDGPHVLAPSDGSRSCDFDCLHVIRNSDHPVYGIVDGRLTTCYVLQQVLESTCFRFDPFDNLGYVGPCTRRDMRTIARSSSIALSHSKRILRPTRLQLKMEAQSRATSSS